MNRPDTIVLIHGLWMTPLSWQNWLERYEKAGYTVLAPAWPGAEGDIEDVRRDPSKLNGLGVTEVADHYERLIRQLDRPPILVGHSFGGTIVQVLLSRGLGAAGVALDPAPIKGVLRLPVSSIRSSLPVLKNPANRGRTVGLTPEQFHYGFANTLNAADSRQAWERFHIPAPGRPLFQAAFANFNPNAATKVDLRKPDRAPLLLVAGGSDRIVPPSLVREAHHRYRRSPAVTEYVEFAGRSHFIAGEPGWEEVADHVLDWAVRQTA
ncbi:alpha/beta hydrolase [Amycolatopsis albispora]|uniref:Alpha/beta hydrolase n=1 Tax=Amycolatopsis albispora TaxID=1804986 RepID=A0A344LA73_9PSEU|nr:alpha/beta hydrolase [Amycolatopsis albispora]AXB44947.1 alpha/beta hydrolase [Amycolatopsis albispora]